MRGLTVLDMARERLIADGYDGLFNGDADCACLVADLAPCGEVNGEECRAGWKVPCGSDCGEHEWHISNAKDGERVDP